MLPGGTTFWRQLFQPQRDVVSAVGKQFAQPLKPYDSEGRPKHHIVRQALRDRSMSVLDRFEAWIDRFSVLKRGGLPTPSD